MEEALYFLGIDGGGTKTAYLLADSKMRVCRREIGEGCNPMDIGLDQAIMRLREGIESICRGIPLSEVAMFAGISGGASSDNRAVLYAFFQRLGFCACENDTDNRNIIAAGLGREDGVTLILGTGVCAFSQISGVRRRYAGWGYLFDNGGSAYNIGRDGLAAHFEALDGIGQDTAISRILIGEHSDEQALLGKLYDGGKKEIASYARAVYAAAREADPVALSILQRNMRCAARLIEVASNPLQQERVPVVLSGGLTAEPLTIACLREALTVPERYDLRILDCEPVQGALILARELYERRKGMIKP